MLPENILELLQAQQFYFLKLSPVNSVGRLCSGMRMDCGSRISLCNSQSSENIYLGGFHHSTHAQQDIWGVLAKVNCCSWSLLLRWIFNFLSGRKRQDPIYKIHWNESSFWNGSFIELNGYYWVDFWISSGVVTSNTVGIFLWL